MTYLKLELCKLLDQLGVTCDSGMWWCFFTPAARDESEVVRETYGEWSLSTSPTAEKTTSAYSLPLLLADSEAMKLIWGEMVVCAGCGTMWSLPSHCCSNMENEARSLKAGDFMAHQFLDLLLANKPEEAEQLLAIAVKARSEEL